MRTRSSGAAFGYGESGIKKDFMILLRLILIFLIVYLLVRGFIRSLSSDDHSPGANNNQNIKTPEKPKKISKSIGEYVDYEEKGKKD